MKTINHNKITFSITQLKQRYILKLNESLSLLKKNKPSKDPTIDAIEYMLSSNSKLLRPQLVYLTGLEFGADINHLDSAALAIEMIHVYSLIHDDLPAMDNSPLRRGQMSCHKKFSEATAILAGDALMSWAYQILSQPTMRDIPCILDIIQTLSYATGPQGMILGQSLDLQYQNQSPNEAQLSHMHALKTAALIQASVKIGALIGNIKPNILESLDKFGYYYGLAFQIKDDMLDFNSNQSHIGKPSHQDHNNNYCHISNYEQAQYQLSQHIQQAHFHLGQIVDTCHPMFQLLENLHTI